MSTSNLEAKFVGGLVGTALGDAVGQRAFGLFDSAALESRIASIQDLFYTDDTAMAIGIAQVLAAEGRLEPERLGRQFHENYRREPWRGYAQGPPELFAIVEQHQLSYREAATRLYQGQGSFGNGGAMRIAPVGLFHADSAELDEIARTSAEVTHAHPLGQDGAAVQAAAIAQATSLDSGDPFSPDRFCEKLKEVARTTEMSAKIELAIDLLRREARPDEAADELGQSVAVHESQPFALYAFLLNPKSYKDCVMTAVLNGGDCDTLGAMSGAIAGAYLGAAMLPIEWVAKLENGSYITAFARRL